MFNWLRNLWYKAIGRKTFAQYQQLPHSVKHRYLEMDWHDVFLYSLHPDYELGYCTGIGIVTPSKYFKYMWE